MTTPDPFAPGYRLTDGNQLNYEIANPSWSISGPAVATPGGTMLTSTEVSFAITNVTTASTSGAGLTLPQALPGKIFLISNNSPNDIRIFANGKSTIDGLDGSIGLLLAKNTTGLFIGIAPKQWQLMNLTGTTGISSISLMSALRLTQVTPGAVVYLEGYHSIGDNGSGYFYGAPLAAAGTYVDDGGVTIVPTGGNGSQAWIRTVTDTVFVGMFGTYSDGVHDDSVGINKALAYCKSFMPTNTMPTLKFSMSGETISYFINNTLNFTGIRVSSLFMVDFQGCNLQGRTTGYPVIDMLDSFYVKLKNMTMYGVPGHQPTYGIQMGRGLLGRDAANCALEDITLEGYFTVAAFLNDGAEVLYVQKCIFQNSSLTGTCVTIDSVNLSNVQSQFFTVNIPVNAYTASLTVNNFVSCTFEQISGVGVSAPAISFLGPVQGFCFKNCYLQNNYSDGIWIRGNLLNGTYGIPYGDIEFDIHYEPVALVNCIKCLTSYGEVLLNNFVFDEYFMFATNSFITTNGGASICQIKNSTLSIDNSYTTAPIFKPVTGPMYYTGTINLGANTNLYNLTNLSGLAGQINCSAPDIYLSLPAIRNVTVCSYNSNRTTYPGEHLFNGSFRLSPGVTLASAASLVIPAEGFSFYVTGSTNITSLPYASSNEGRIVLLTFGGTFTLANSYANGTLLATAAPFGGSTNNSILLYSDGTVWVEISRTDHVVQ